MIIQDVECWVPPPGFVFDRHPEVRDMVAVPIYSRSEKKEEQYWEIPPEPENYKAKRRKEKHIQEGSKGRNYVDAKPDHYDPELTAYINQEWFRRMNGFWFMNNGVPTYLTGVHYFYLAHWVLNTGKVDFRWPDLQYFYFWASCFEDPRCLGMINFANRQSGKSFRAGCILYELISRTRSVSGGIQSKNEKDAGVFYTKCVTTPLGKLKDFFIPVYDKQLGLDSKSKLRFFRKTASGDEKIEYDDNPLESEIDFRESSARAYDNTTLKLCVEDEFGKLEAEHSLLERHSTVKWCLFAVDGKFLYCTTVEDMSSGKCIRESNELFMQSDPLVRPANNQTESGLYRFRLPAYETFKFDKYGMALSGCREMLQSQADVFLAKGDYIGYASFKRKQPFSDSDIFRVSAKAPIWDIIKISDQLNALTLIEPELLRVSGNFSWERGERDGKVKFVQMKTGRFSIHPDLLRQMEGEEQNLARPINKHRFAVGCDPIEQKFAVTPSNAAAYAYKYPDSSLPHLDHWILLEYCGRPQSSVFFEDMIKMCVFLGTKINIENNLSGLINHFTDRGYGAFLYWPPGAKKPGTYSSTESKDEGSALGGEYVTDYCQCIPFPALLEDMAMFDLSDSTKFDRSMAFIMLMLMIGNRSATKKDKNRPIEVEEVFRSHKIRR